MPFIRTGEYKGPGKEIENNYLYRAVQAPNGHVYVYFKGTTFTSYSQWKENYAAAFRGQRVPAWDQALNETRARFGYESSRVTYTGFSRGSALAQYQGGTGYGLGRHPFPAYPPRAGSKWYKSRDPIHDALLAEHLPGNMEASQSAMGVYGKRKPDETAVVDDRSTKKPTVNKEEPTDTTWLMPADDPRNPWTYAVQIRRYRDGFWYFDVGADGEAVEPGNYQGWSGHRGAAVPGQGYGDYDDLKALANTNIKGQVAGQDGSVNNDDMEVGTPSTPIVTVPVSTPIGLGFAGLVTTFVNPVSGRIIGYKGIPRKRKFSSLERYSPFWKEHNRLTQNSVLVGPSQA